MDDFNAAGEKTFAELSRYKWFSSLATMQNENGRYFIQAYATEQPGEGIPLS